MKMPQVSLCLSTLIVLATSTLAVAQPAASVKPTVQQQLIHAVIQDKPDQVRDLLAAGADPNGRSAFDNEDKWMLTTQPNMDSTPPAIVLACRFRSISGPTVISVLLNKGAKVNIADANGVTPLMAASGINGPIDMLFERKADVNAADKFGRTPLMYAMDNLGYNTAAQLLEHGAHINTHDSQGQTALMLAITGARRNPIRLYGEDQAKKSIESKVAPTSI